LTSETPGKPFHSCNEESTTVTEVGVDLQQPNRNRQHNRDNHHERKPRQTVTNTTAQPSRTQPRQPSRTHRTTITNANRDKPSQTRTATNRHERNRTTITNATATTVTNANRDKTVTNATATNRHERNRTPSTNASRDKPSRTQPHNHYEREPRQTVTNATAQPSRTRAATNRHEHNRTTITNASRDKPSRTQPRQTVTNAGTTVEERRFSAA
jgi:hypothetical protein